MSRMKLDVRVRTLIENGVKTRHRSMFAIIGDKARDQIPILYHILAKSTVSLRPSVLWCYKKDLGFSSHRKKRIKEIERKVAAGVMHAREDDPFEMFISSTEVRYCYYAESQKILGNTFGMLVLQDFEALTPNLLARTVETVEGGGLIVFLLQSVDSLRQLYTLNMDVHGRYRTEAHSCIVPRFNERFILSLASCRACVVMDDRLNVLPISSHISKIESMPSDVKYSLSLHEEKLDSLRETMSDTPPFGALLKLCKTLCQANALLKLLDVATNNSLNETCSVTAARGRGKSAVLGLAIAGAIVFKFTNIFVTSPTPENLRTLFDFVVKGLEAFDYKEHADYEIIKSLETELNKCIVRINVFREHRQIIQYISPTDASKLGPAELVVIDEAAAIPMPLVHELISGNHLVFLASTINGYEGTGRSLSLKLLDQLRRQTDGFDTGGKSGITARKKLHEISLEESIRYNADDQVEAWLNKVLCLDCINMRCPISGTPSPSRCELYYVNRDTLFSFHKASETFLANMMSIYVSAHYKNTPNDLQMLSDAPAHHLFVLMAPVISNQTSIPQILAIVQVAMEGGISSSNVANSLEKGRRTAGDLIPWTISQQFLDNEFPTLCGARIVRIAVHPEFQNMGYGSRAVQLLLNYYQGGVPCDVENIVGGSSDSGTDSADEEKSKSDGEFALLEEKVGPRANLPPLLMRLSERCAECIDYIGVSFGLTLSLLKFWKRHGFIPLYLRQSASDLTAEHTCMVLNASVKQRKVMSLDIGNGEPVSENSEWLLAYFREFRHRFISLLGFVFAKFTPHLALSMMHLNSVEEKSKTVKALSRNELAVIFSNSDLRRISEYARNMVDQSLIVDLFYTIATTYFNERIDVTIDLRQAAVLLSVGLQRKSIEQTAKELDLPVNQTFAFLNKALRHISNYFDGICKLAVESQMSLGAADEERMQDMIDKISVPTLKSLEEDLADAEVEIRKRQAADKRRLESDESLKARFAIRGQDDEWDKAVAGINLTSAKSGIISVKGNRMPVGTPTFLPKKNEDGEVTGAKASGGFRPGQKRKRKR